MGLANMHKRKKKLTPIPLFLFLWTAHKVRALIYNYFFLRALLANCLIFYREVLYLMTLYVPGVQAHSLSFPNP